MIRYIITDSITERVKKMNIGRISEASAQISATTPKTAAQETEKKDTTLAADNTDKFVESETTYTPAYTKATAGKSVTNAASDSEAATVKVSYKSARQIKNESMQSWVNSTVDKQSTLAWAQIGKDKIAEANDTNGDFWGADATAQRIFDFAKNLAGDNDELYQTLRDAVDEGFAQAGKLFSKKTGEKGLPSVCNDTYDKVMTMFDDWKKEIDGKSTSKTDDKTADKTTEAAAEKTSAKKNEGYFAQYWK